MISEWSAIEKLEQLAADDEPLQASVDMSALDAVLHAQQRLEDGGELVEGEAEAAKAVLMFLTVRLERIERDLIRHLKFESETPRTWDQVAAEFGDAYGHRAAVFNRWKRLCDADRRSTSMDMRRGAAVPRARRSVVDTTTDEEVDPNQTDLLSN